jgi:hypothetical protein
MGEYKSYAKMSKEELVKEIEKYNLIGTISVIRDGARRSKILTVEEKKEIDRTAVKKLNVLYKKAEDDQDRRFLDEMAEKIEKEGI